MNWLQAMSQSIDYIESHLDQPISITDIAKVASTSPYYYQRMFTMLTDMSVTTYIRNRRLTQAAIDLKATKEKVIDIALRYQYESAEAFTRAFKNLHGLTPSQARKDRATIQAFLKLTIQLQLKGALPMKYRIETKPAFSFYGISKQFSTIDGANFKEIPLFWNQVMIDHSFDKMIEYSDDNKSLGVCMPMDPDKETDFNYVIGGFTQKPVEGYANHSVEATTWAIFELKGPIQETIQPTWKRIFSEWFPQTGYKHDNLPELEVYFSGNPNAEDYYMEIWIPIIQD